MKYYYFLSFLLILTSCKKNENTTKEDECLPIKKETIVGRYKITTLEEKEDNGTIRNDLANMPACSQDDIYNFDANGILYIEAGAAMCNGNSNSIIKQGDYTVEYDNSGEYTIVVKWSSTSLNDWGPVTCVNSKTITCYEEWTNSSGTKLYFKRVWTKV